MSLSTLDFVYLPDQSQALTYNYLDTVNVIWKWDDPSDGSKIGLILWLQNAGASNFYAARNDTSLQKSGSDQYALNYQGTEYPAVGHFNLIVYDANGTQIGGPNSASIAVTQQSKIEPVCQNCISQGQTTTASITTQTSSPTGTSSESSFPSTSTGSSIQAVATTTNTPLVDSTSSSTSTLSDGAVAGIAVGCALVILGLIVVVFLKVRRRRRQHNIYEMQAHGHGPPDLSQIGNKSENKLRPNDSKDQGLIAEKDGAPLGPELPTPAYHEMGTER